MIPPTLIAAAALAPLVLLPAWRQWLAPGPAPGRAGQRPRHRKAAALAAALDIHPNATGARPCCTQQQTRAAANAAAAAAAGAESERLRAALSTADQRIATAAESAVRDYATTANAVLADLERAGAEIARGTGHASDVRAYAEAWPVNPAQPTTPAAQPPQP